MSGTKIPRTEGGPSFFVYKFVGVMFHLTRLVYGILPTCRDSINFINQTPFSPFRGVSSTVNLN